MGAARVREHPFTLEAIRAKKGGGGGGGGEKGLIPCRPARVRTTSLSKNTQDISPKMKYGAKNSTTLREPNWDLISSRQTWTKLFLKIFPGADWKSTSRPDNRSVRWAVSELEAKGVVGDDFVEIQRSEGGARLKIVKGGGGRFILQADGGEGRYLITARWLDMDETLEIAESYNAGQNDWLYSSRWEDSRNDEPVGHSDHQTEESGGEEGKTLVLSVAFLPIVGIAVIVLGGGGGILGILALTVVAAVMISSPILIKAAMARLDGREVVDDESGLVRISWRQAPDAKH